MIHTFSLSLDSIWKGSCWNIRSSLIGGVFTSFEKYSKDLRENKTFIFSKRVNVISRCCKNFETLDEGDDSSVSQFYPNDVMSIKRRTKFSFPYLVKPKKTFMKVKKAPFFFCFFWSLILKIYFISSNQP